VNLFGLALVVCRNPHAEKIKVAHPLMLRAIAVAKKKNDKIDASKIADCLAL
jgi:transposase